MHCWIPISALRTQVFLNIFLGFKVARTQANISLYQRKYTLDLIKDTCLLGEKPCNTPMQPQLQLHKSSGEVISNPKANRRLIGRWLYLTHTRLGIAYVVTKLSKLLDTPTTEHMLAGLHVLKYLNQCSIAPIHLSSSRDSQKLHVNILPRLSRQLRKKLLSNQIKKLSKGRHFNFSLHYAFSFITHTHFLLQSTFMFRPYLLISCAILNPFGIFPCLYGI